MKITPVPTKKKCILPTLLTVAGAVSLSGCQQQIVMGAYVYPYNIDFSLLHKSNPTTEKEPEAPEKGR